MKLLQRKLKKRWRHPVLVLLSGGLVIGLLAYLHPPSPSNVLSPSSSCHGRRLLNAEADGNKTAQFPEDLFTREQRRKGAVACHLLGTVYMFVALAIVCDEFFVPSLDVITEKLDISEDVAGATFMAAGGSAPELFTSVIGVFISFDDVGIGTIVGSAVFNILFVISMCAIFSKSVLELTWWPLFRDVTFYSITLIILILCFLDNVIYWYEATTLLTCYLCYVTFMKFNANIEHFIKKFVNRNKVTRVGSADQLVPNNAKKRRMSAPMLHGGGTKFRNGLVQLMIHSIDPLHDGKLDEKATQLHAIASLRVLLDATKGNNGVVTRSPAACPSCSRSAVHPATCDHVQETSISTVSGAHEELARSDNLQPDNPPLSWVNKSTPDKNTVQVPLSNGVPNNTTAAPSTTTTMESGEDEDEKPLDMSWPNNWRKRITYIALLPLLFPMWLTLPDVRRPEKRKFFPMTFIGSIMWIAVFSYLMVWWASLVGDTAGIPNEVMGLTFLAAGTSIPDLITSVLVARKGFGDMAVSSSVGSNIFDVAVGLPLPWLLACFIFGPVAVSSSGMICSIVILFMMLLFVIISIAAFKWKMNVGLAMVMFLLYFVFIAVSLMFEYKVLNCENIMAALHI